MFSAQAYANSRPNGIAVLEILAKPKSGQGPRFVPLRRTVANGRWLGPLAEITVTHVFGYTKAQYDRVLEAVYRFPLPGDAAVRKVVVTFGEVEIVADLKERAQAEADYEEARRQGWQAALVTRESPDVFTLQVTGLKPDEEIVVETSYVQLAAPEDAGWTLRVPLTTPPRYSRSDERTTAPSKGQPLLVMRDPGHRFSLDLLIPASGSVESSTHQLDVADEDGLTRVRLREREVVPDRDCVLTWRPAQEQDRPSLHVIMSADRGADQTYFLAHVAPPSVLHPNRDVAREVILLVDHSGSMSGAKWEAADWAALKMLGDLTERDRYNLAVFESKTRWLGKAPRQAGSNAVGEGKRFLGASRDGGGTELGVALEQALHQSRGADERSRQVAIITDAQVTDFARLLRLVEEETRQKNRRRVSVLCIDAAPNSFLVLELAKRGGGVARFLTSMPGEGDITTALDEIVSGWAQPVLAGLRLEVNRPKVEAPERELLPGGEEGWSAVDLGDLCAGRSLWIAGRVAGTDTMSLAFRLRREGDREVEAWRTKVVENNAGALRATFGAWRVLGLESLLVSGRPLKKIREQLVRLGYDPEEALLAASSGPATVYHENAINAAAQPLHDLLVREALDYGLLCSATGFAAVRKEAGKQVEGTVLVANGLPPGWSTGTLRSAGPPKLRPEAHFGSLAEDATMGMARASAEPDVRAMRTKAQSILAIDAFGVDVPDNAASRSKPETLFSGVLPPFSGGQAVLFDSRRSADALKLGAARRFSVLRLRFFGAIPQPEDVDPSLALLLYVGDMAAPAAKVRLVDMLRQGGSRPLSVERRGGEHVRLVLDDPNGALAASAPQIEIALE